MRGSLNGGRAFGVGAGDRAGRNGEGAVEIRPVVHPMGVRDAAGGKVCGEGPVADHGRGEGHADELAEGLVLEVLVGSFAEQCAGPSRDLGWRAPALVQCGTR